MDLTLEDYRRQLETNVFGVLRTLFAALPELRKTRGRIVVVGSLLGVLPVPVATPYCMSKFALAPLCDGLSHELAPLGVSVTLILPGFVASEIYQVDNRGVRLEAPPSANRPADRLRRLPPQAHPVRQSAFQDRERLAAALPRPGSLRHLARYPTGGSPALAGRGPPVVLKDPVLSNNIEENPSLIVC